MTDAPDYGEPWYTETQQGRGVYSDKEGYLGEFEDCDDTARAIACVNACRGIPDPERVITRLFESEDELDRLAREVAELDLDNPYLGLAVKQVQKSAKDILAVLHPTKREGE